MLYTRPPTSRTNFLTGNNRSVSLQAVILRRVLRAPGHHLSTLKCAVINEAKALAEAAAAAEKVKALAEAEAAAAQVQVRKFRCIYAFYEQAEQSALLNSVKTPRSKVKGRPTSRPPSSSKAHSPPAQTSPQVV
jgi:hypothetical protein